MSIFGVDKLKLFLIYNFKRNIMKKINAKMIGTFAGRVLVTTASLFVALYAKQYIDSKFGNAKFSVQETTEV